MNYIGYITAAISSGILLFGCLKFRDDEEGVTEVIPYTPVNPYPQRDFPENERRAELEKEYYDYLAAIKERSETISRKVDTIVGTDEQQKDDDEEVDSEIDAREKWRVSIIDPRDYQEGEPGQDREEFLYYELDDTIVDSDGVPVDDPDILGDALGRWGELGAPPDQVFVRNREMHMDICVTRVNRSYHESVLGIHIDDEDSGILKFRALNE